MQDEFLCLRCAASLSKVTGLHLGTSMLIHDRIDDEGVPQHLPEQFPWKALTCETARGTVPAASAGQRF